ncbi:hypothetical protein NDU88_001178 [Pleurodeles waltl]|uniref:Uncharacterized protein n=1 Tax=Pleurodeles waltl TaxID=8319 RepID=A0AAV7MMZ2_PLEWA|nr:hypothetical protein NDU88_001178 [Pleurodeles waltl]
MPPPLRLTAPESPLPNCWLPAGVHLVALSGEGPPPAEIALPCGEGATDRSTADAIGRGGHHNTSGSPFITTDMPPVQLLQSDQKEEASDYALPTAYSPTQLDATYVPDFEEYSNDDEKSYNEHVCGQEY